jgi:hypothetical protein
MAGMRSPLVRTFVLTAAVGLACSVAGCGGDDDPATHAADTSTGVADGSTDSSGPAYSSSATTTAVAPQAVCDFADSWQSIDQQLTDAESHLDDEALWGDTADAMEAVTPPDAISVWSLLAGRVRSYADALAGHDQAQVEGFRASQLKELEQVHQSVHALLDQGCP